MHWTVYDALAHPGEPVDILCRCESRLARSLRLFRSGKEATLRVGEHELPVRSGKRGFARAVTPPFERPGVHPARIGSSPSGEGRVWIVPRDRPVFLTDLDRTVSLPTAWGFWLRSLSRIRPFPKAGETLERISRDHFLIYLTARTDLLLGKSRRWFKKYNFPEGPVLCRYDFRRDPGEEAFKTRVVGELKARWPDIRMAVGDKASDIRAYRTHDVPAVRFGRPDPDAPAPEVRVCRSWKEVEESLLPAGNEPAGS